MSELVDLRLVPLNRHIKSIKGETLQDALFSQGVEFPCGGRGLCKGCRVRVLEGELSPTVEDSSKFTPAELEAGWRLGCRARPNANLTIEIAQWEACVLDDTTRFSFTPSPGFGVAVDLGTTTIVAQLLDLQTSNVLGVRTGLNAQAQHGADVLSRIEYAVSENGQQRLTNLIRAQVGSLVTELLSDAPHASSGLARIAIVGNTAMHHLFCGLDLASLATYPFEPVTLGPQMFSPNELGWNFPANPLVEFLPCLGGFVGSDILAGILATGMADSPDLCVLLDLGTNGEIVVGNKDRLLCTSTAAGPAFEGAMISMGMRASTGAISEVSVSRNSLRCTTIGGGTPRGVCGSGLVDAVAAGLDLGWILPRGRLVLGEFMPLTEDVRLNQVDVRQLQLAKAAIAAGVRVLLHRWGAEASDVRKLFLSGAFGNYVSQSSARRIGLVELPLHTIIPSGNTALLGVKMALFQDASGAAYQAVLSKCTHVSLKEDPAFQDAYVDAMFFPDVSKV